MRSGRRSIGSPVQVCCLSNIIVYTCMLIALRASVPAILIITLLNESTTNREYSTDHITKSWRIQTLCTKSYTRFMLNCTETDPHVGTNMANR